MCMTHVCRQNNYFKPLVPFNNKKTIPERRLYPIILRAEMVRRLLILLRINQLKNFQIFISDNFLEKNMLKISG